uniref:Uncharacterized protein n=1 Tax=Oxyrrhis marina TaxID=2969 RepID=A0A7S4LNA6_OXYMA
MGEVYEDLHREVTAKRAELERVAQQLEDARNNVEGLKRRSKEIAAPGLVPAQLQAGGAVATSQLSSQETEMQSFLLYVAQHVDLKTPPTAFHHGVPFNIGAAVVNLGDSVQYPLVNAGEMRLTVPAAVADAIAGTLERAREGAGLDATTLRSWTQDWELLIGAPDPAVFLIHRVEAMCIVMATWPEVRRANFQSVFQGCKVHPTSSSMPEAMCSEGHPARWSCGMTLSFFCSRCAASCCGVRWCCRRCGENICGICMAPPQGRRQVGSVRRPFASKDLNVPELTNAKLPEPQRSSFTVGDRVEVEYGDRWYTGVLYCCKGQRLGIRCDVDEANVVTYAPVTRVRHFKQEDLQQQEQQAEVGGHRRIHSFS